MISVIIEYKNIANNHEDKTIDLPIEWISDIKAIFHDYLSKYMLQFYLNELLCHKIPNRHFVAFQSKTCNHAFAYPRQIRMMAKCFTAMNI
jgi:hypothetical protein